MSGTDAASLSDEDVLQAVTTNRKPVPVPPIGSGTGNQFPEPSGTTGTDAPLFEPLAVFLERTRDLPPLSWLIEGMVPDSGNLLVVSAPGVGKTFLALIIARKAAEAGRRALLVLEEGRPRSMFDRFSALAFRSDGPVLIAHRKGVRLDDENARAQIAKLLHTHEAPVLVLDPFSSLFHGDENDTGAVNQAKEQVQRLATINPRALIVLLHHTSKAGERGEGPAIYAARGSTVLPGWADMQLNLTRERAPSGPDRVAFLVEVAKGRDGGTAQRYCVTISLGDGAVEIGDESEADAQDKAQQVRSVLGSATAPLSKSKVAERVPGRRQDVFQVIKAMEARGELRQEGRGLVLVQKVVMEGES
jgi:hypothetical protein